MANYQITYTVGAHGLDTGALTQISADHWDLDETGAWFDFFGDGAENDLVLTIKADKVLSVHKLED